MTKKLNTTVHIEDDKGAVHVFGPDDELPGWAEKQLSESWGDRDDLWDGESVAPEELSVEDALKQGTPPPDRGPVEQDEPQGRDAEAIDLAQGDDGEVKGRGRRK